MVSGVGQDEPAGENINITLQRNLAGHKSQSAISIPSAYQFCTNNTSQEGGGGPYFVPTNTSFGLSSGVGSRGTLPHPSRNSSRSVLGPGYYHRTLSSSSLLNNKSSVAKSRSDYSSVGVGPSAFSSSDRTSGSATGSGVNPSSNFRRGIHEHAILSGSSSNIIYIDNNLETESDPSPPPFWGHPHGGGGGGGGGGNGGTTSSSLQRERDRELIREREQRRITRDSSQPIIINVPITAPKATATTLSRATSPPPPSLLFGLGSSSSGGSPKKTSLQEKKKGGGGIVISRGPTKTRFQQQHHQQQYYSHQEGWKQSKEESDGKKSTGTNTGNSVDEKDYYDLEESNNKVPLKQRQHHHCRRRIPPPPRLAKYWKNAPLKRLKHPLEENIFSSLVITLVAVGVALVFGIPVLCLTGGCLILAISVRYFLYVVHGCFSYLRFICSTRSSRQHQHNLHRSSNLQSSSSGHHHPGVLHHESPPKIIPRDRLAFANDVRWLGKKKARRCQSILHTLLVFEGTMDLPCLRHLVQTRVLHAETPEGELAYPRLLQKIISLPSGFQWQLDVTFDIVNHVFLGPSHVRGESELQEYLGRLLTESLPLGKPLWEIRVLTNYGPQRDTIAILRVHQTLADGMSLVRILSHSLADHSQMHIPVRPHFAGLSFSFNFIRSLIVGPLTFFMWIFATFKDYSLFSLPLRSRRNGRRSVLLKRKKKTSDQCEEFNHGEDGDEVEDEDDDDDDDEEEEEESSEGLESSDQSN